MSIERAIPDTREPGIGGYALEPRRFAVLVLFWVMSGLFWAGWFVQAPLLHAYWVGVKHVASGDAEYLLSAVNLAGIATALAAGFTFDRLRPRRATLLCFALSTVGFGLRPLAAGSLPWMIAATVVGGLGGVPIMVAAPAVVAQWFGRHRMTLALAVAVASFPLGQALGLQVAAPLETRIGITWTLALFSFAMLAALIAWYFLVPDAPRQPAGPPPLRQASLAVGLREIVGSVQSWLLFLIGVVLPGIAVYTVSLFPTVGIDFALPAGAAGFLLGYLARRIGHSDRLGLGLAVLLAVAWLVLTLVVHSGSVPAAEEDVLIGVVGFCYQPCFAFALEAMESAPVVRPETVGAASGFYFTGVGIGGFVLPQIFAHFTQADGPNAGMVGVLVLAIALVVLWLPGVLWPALAGRYRPADAS